MLDAFVFQVFLFAFRTKARLHKSYVETNRKIQQAKVIKKSKYYLKPFNETYDKAP